MNSRNTQQETSVRIIMHARFSAISDDSHLLEFTEYRSHVHPHVSSCEVLAGLCRLPEVLSCQTKSSVSVSSVAGVSTIATAAQI
jgi:hypothetical protein